MSVTQIDTHFRFVEARPHIGEPNFAVYSSYGLRKVNLSFDEFHPSVITFQWSSYSNRHEKNGFG